MGHGFGNLGVHLRHIVYNRISMFEQKAFKGLLNPGLKNTVRRITETGPRTVPYFLITYLIITQTDAYYAQSIKKNPADYENDK